MKKAFVILLVLSTFISKSLAQNNGRVSEPNDSLRAAAYINIARNTFNTDSSLHYCSLALDCCRPTDTLLLAMVYHMMGWRYNQKHEIYTSIQYLRKAFHYYNPERDYEGHSICCVILAQDFEMLHLADSAFFYLNKSLENSILRNDTAQMATAYLNLGRVCMTLTMYDNAEEYFNKSILLDSLSGNDLDMACGYYWLGYLNIETKNHRMTGECLRKAIRIFQSYDHVRSYYAMNLHLAYSYMADTYIASAERTGITRYADSCLVYTKMGSDFFLKNGQNANYMIARYAYVKYLMFYKKYNEALDVLKDCEVYMTGSDLRRDYHKYLTLVYSKLGKYKDALEHQQKHYEYAMEYLNDSSLTALADSKTHQAILQKEAEQRQTDRIHHEQTRRMQIIIGSLLVVLIMASLLIIFVVRMWNLKKKANNEILAQQKELSAVHNAVVESMRYSERIQRAVIPNDDFIKSLFPKSFVYYRPRDIVSGDFYHAVKCGKYSVFVVADCTGHGIPGGFLSMLGISSLKEYLVTEDDAANPGKVLDSMRTFFKETLCTTNDKLMPIYDGMDIIICSFDIENKQLIYAAANHKAIIVRNGEAIKLLGDKMPVGRYFLEKEHFDTFTVPLQSGDMVYLFTDGIQDQTGSPDAEHPFGKKMMAANLVTILIEMANLPPVKQSAVIDDYLIKWRNGFDQIDDITLVGIQI